MTSRIGTTRTTSCNQKPRKSSLTCSKSMQIGESNLDAEKSLRLPCSLQSTWLLEHALVSPRYEDFESFTFDLCIVDEAERVKANASGNPYSTGSFKKWILVGDEKQLSPFQMTEMQDSKQLEKFDLRKEDFKKSLFSHLSEKLPKDCIVTLDTQHRMVAPIGNLVSECFYEGSLKSNGPNLDETLAELFKSPVMWFSTTPFNSPF